ncbi:hypothetical protein P153DRAFT_418841 [Dothidotthia symphoricarpi CBS 119687]|uniref:RING-type domain-containing protein n=1 Tax=Dothidotthia symphoricarpi CBS 119687 TaxID=1392245 RepID=A0A6A6AGR6_9PLEO|nr:uncharacterized protein P153DRAFT_418841 [Dothidotthia symphoricarpi CBS 119687]KAF2130114.1 hypothetical protein P153DRAFT_418841 [Dothidotthia symphoricarpi CBS 119687]
MPPLTSTVPTPIHPFESPTTLPTPHYPPLSLPDVEMDVLTRVAYLVLGLRDLWALRGIIGGAEEQRIVQEVEHALAEEVVSTLHALEMWGPRSDGDVKLENIGPDHNVEDFGREVLRTGSEMDDNIDTAKPDDPDPDPSQRCGVCLDAYTSSHPAFLISACNHIIGKPCLDTWLNGTAQNANLCPFCRMQMCERRARRPTGPSTNIFAEQNALVNRLTRALLLLQDMDILLTEFFAGGYAGSWLADTMCGVNMRLFENGVGFAFVQDEMEDLGWRLRRVDWAASD